MNPDEYDIPLIQDEYAVRRAWTQELEDSEGIGQ